MNRRELRESIFQLLFMTEFNPSEEMGEQKELYLDGIENLQEKDQAYIQEKWILQFYDWLPMKYYLMKMCREKWRSMKR